MGNLLPPLWFIGSALLIGIWVWMLYRFGPSGRTDRNTGSYVRLTDHTKAIASIAKNAMLSHDAHCATPRAIGYAMRYREVTKAIRHTPAAQYATSDPVALPRILRYLKEIASMFTKQVTLQMIVTVINVITRVSKYDCRKEAVQEKAFSKLSGLRMKFGFWTTSTSPANTIAPKTPTKVMMLR